MSLILNDTWVLWSHEINDNDWTIKSYSIVYEFNTINDFWKLYNNFHLLDGLHKKNYFLMRKGITPIWEDVKNKNGGICSIKILLTKAHIMWEELSMYLIGETFSNNKQNMDRINGISICPKNIWSIIKIWNSDSTNDISTDLPKEFRDKYNKCTIKYKVNQAEY
jgi:hypothetical protein